MIRTVVGASLAAGIVSSLTVFPYSISYFNFAVGGPGHGQWHLLDGNIDWGQDLLRLREWMDDHPDVRPMCAEVPTFVPSHAAGIAVDPIPINKKERPSFPPGWYAVSLNYLNGYRLAEETRQDLTWFKTQEAVDRIGYSILVCHIED